MVFSLITRFLGDIIGVLIAIATVVLFSYFDPFGWFNPNTKIEGTALMVREVKEIGELITAEYYGEAITSWPAVYYESGYSQDSIEVSNLIQTIYESLHILQQNAGEEWDKKAVWKSYKRNLRDIWSNHYLYEYLVDYINNDNNIQKSVKKEQEAIFGIFNDEWSYDNALITAVSRKYRNNILEKDKVKRKKNVVCIGRGIVRAGVDLSGVDENDIFYDENRKIIFIRNATPKILSVDMNPWFIPERGVKGFEIIKLKGKIDYRDIDKLKGKCKSEIRQQALEREIVEKAKENAETALHNFFSLLMEDPLERVVILSDPLEVISFESGQKEYLSPEEACYIFESTYRYYDEYSHDVNAEELSEIIRSLNEKWIIMPGQKDTNAVGAFDTTLINLDIYNVLAIKQHYKIPSVSDTLPVGKIDAFIKLFWADTTFTRSEVKERLEKIKEISG